MTRILIQTGGVALVLAALGDVYLTVLYARAGIGVFSQWLGPAVWRVFRWVANPFPRVKHVILSFCGPTILVAMVATWVTMLICGFALVVWPALGTSVQAVRNDTPTDFATAIYFSGYCFTTIGNGDLVPVTGAFRLMAVFASVVGMSTITLTLTYFLQIYNALHRRNTLALMVYHASGDTANAAEFLARVGNGGELDPVRNELTALSKDLFHFHESHHFYGTLPYFHFPEPYYAPSWIVITIIDSVTLIRTVLDERHYGPLQRCAAVSQTWDGGMHLLREFGKLLLPKGLAARAKEEEPDDETVAEWRIRFFEAAARLRDAGMPTTADEVAGAEKYVALRKEWEGYVRAFCEYLRQPPIDEAARKRSDERAGEDGGEDEAYSAPEPMSAEEMQQQKRAG